MADLAVLSIVLLLAALLLWAWRERGRAVEKALAAEAEARRARQIDSAAADATDLLAAALTSLQLARSSLEDDSDPATCRVWLADAELATRAIAGLFESARVYVRDADGNRPLGAEACLRLAVAIARADGRGVALRGDRSDLGCDGSPRAAIALFTELLARASTGSGGKGYVTVELADDSVVVHAANAAPIDLGGLAATAATLGWSMTFAPDGAHTVVVARRAAEGTAEDPSLRRIPAGVLSN